MLGIKGMQKDAFLSKEALQLIGRKTFIESDELQYWKQAIDEVLDPMSGDYQIAIENGSTMIRVGSSIFGDRNYIT